MGRVLGIIYRDLNDGATGAVTLIQRFASALNLNIHFHLLFLDGIYLYRDGRPPRFQRVKATGKGGLEELAGTRPRRRD
jgi:hypothetical protein